MRSAGRVFLSIAWLAAANSQLACVDDEGRKVDWFVAYKLPKESGNSTLLAEGLAYAWLSSAEPARGWTLSTLSVGDALSAPGRTLTPLYADANQNGTTAHIFYNDEHPDGKTSFVDGHTKGVLAFGENTGFWLVHSVPKYPPPPQPSQQYDYPHTGQLYGQSFLCLSLATRDQADAVGKQMMFNRPYVYASRVPDAFSVKFPRLAAAAKGQFFKGKPYSGQATLRSLAGAPFLSFAKSSHFDDDLYAALVAPALKTGLLAETWPNGAGKLNSSCIYGHEVENVDSLSFSSLSPQVPFSPHRDHAKWAVSHDAGLPFVCVGDITRIHSQYGRAGGTVCFQQEHAWKSFRAIVNTVEACPSPNQHHNMIQV